ncbi:RES family NAD+ phosphorylase [Pseudoalteromonas sp. OFAV1]|nr:RES family NAD+ phosphorylase [Pseudoalteromonas sp. OFAV1]
MLERQINDPQEIIKRDLVPVIIKIPDKLKILRINAVDLKSDWNVFPYSKEIQMIGSKFLSEKKSAILRVPSSLCAGEYNYIINPMHPDAKFIKSSYHP